MRSQSSKRALPTSGSCTLAPPSGCRYRLGFGRLRHALLSSCSHYKATSAHALTTRTISGLNAHRVPVVTLDDLDDVHRPSRSGWSCCVKGGSTGWTVLSGKTPRTCVRGHLLLQLQSFSGNTCVPGALAFPDTKINGKPLARRYIVHITDALDTGYANVSFCTYVWFKCARCVLAHVQCCVNRRYRSDARIYLDCKAIKTSMNVRSAL